MEVKFTSKLKDITGLLIGFLLIASQLLFCLWKFEIEMGDVLQVVLGASIIIFSSVEKVLRISLDQGDSLLQVTSGRSYSVKSSITEYPVSCITQLTEDEFTKRFKMRIGSKLVKFPINERSRELVDKLRALSNITMD